jgi:hypothetical protein
VGEWSGAFSRNVIFIASTWLVALPTEPVFEKQSWQEDKRSSLGKDLPCLYSYTFADPDFSDLVGVKSSV